MTDHRLHIPPRSRRGLSLQEMMVVVAVFIVLACILILSSNQVIVRSRVSRVQQEQQMISSAVESFRIDNSRYPSVLSRMVRPGGILNEVPIDPFRTSSHSEYTYYCLTTPGSQRRQAIIVSAGPDGDIDFFPPTWTAIAAAPTPSGDNGDEESFDEVAGVSSALAPVRSSEMDPILNEIIIKSYDPTNGTNSDGDIIKLNFN